jgi:hypothetical protein
VAWKALHRIDDTDGDTSIVAPKRYAPVRSNRRLFHGNASFQKKLPSFPYVGAPSATSCWNMSCRLEAIALIQALSVEEGTRQPTAINWLKEQDRMHRQRTRPALEGRMRLATSLPRFPLVAL